MDPQTQMSLEQMKANKEARRYAGVLKDISVVLGTPAGKGFVRYLLKELEVGELPAMGLPEEFLRDKLGFLRAGNSIFKMVAQANPEVTGALLAQIEKEKYEELISTHDQA